jgi:SlyX protein
MDDQRSPGDAIRIELEIKIGFLERTVDALNEVVLEQAGTIEVLGRRLTELEFRVKAPDELEPEPDDPLSERPPHY